MVVAVALDREDLAALVVVLAAQVAVLAPVVLAALVVVLVGQGLVVRVALTMLE
ncbi:hypothetical protein BN873_770004 [Candidatus Competibacter denitrificans Run_A_D11]|uniref:Uncharacterized protein n=1 Tax=Candidatus Competibacter denitrificans Run_A_D11 TaxID=1400863 RepID=W6M7L9_9GAMM|nr:hypothetical protein BN873_770004 [Candidatus Competibacter denitrificans Run_A_D11]